MLNFPMNEISNHSFRKKLELVFDLIRLEGARDRAGKKKRTRYVVGGVEKLCRANGIRRSHLAAWRRILNERAWVVFQDGRLFSRWEYLTETNAGLEALIRENKARLDLLDEQLAAHGKQPPKRRRFRATKES